MRKRILATILTAALLFAAFSGCAKGNSPGTSAAPTGSAESGTGTASTFSGYPMKKEDVKLKWYVGSGYGLNSAYATADESPFHSGLEKQVGVDIEWSFPTAGTDEKQAFNVMLSSGDLPDIFFYYIMSDAQRYMDEKVIRDLSGSLEKNSPNYWAWIHTKPEYDRAVKTDAGQYYGYCFFREAGARKDSYQGPLIREDWLKALSLKEPKTVSDWDAVLKAFKEKYNATFSSPAGRFKPSVFIAGAFGAYGNINSSYYVDKNNKIQLAQAQPEWKAYMQQMSKWWKEGLIDQDILTAEDSNVQTKALNGKTGFAYTSMGQVSNWEKDAKDAKNGAEWAGIEYPTGDDGTLSAVFGGYGIGNGMTVITTACTDDKLEAAMRVLDYAYSKEGQLYWNFGKEGNSWEYNDKKEVEYLPLVTEDKDGLNNAIDKYGGATWQGPCIQLTRLLHLKNTETAIKANDTWFYKHQDVTSKWTVPSSVTYTTEESDKMDEYNSAIDTYVSEQATKFLTGEGSLDSFDNFVSQLNSMGLPEVLKIRQAAYDRYLAR